MSTPSWANYAGLKAPECVVCCQSLACVVDLPFADETTAAAALAVLEANGCVAYPETPTVVGGVTADAVSISVTISATGPGDGTASAAAQVVVKLNAGDTVTIAGSGSGSWAGICDNIPTPGSCDIPDPPPGCVEYFEECNTFGVQIRLFTAAGVEIFNCGDSGSPKNSGSCSTTFVVPADGCYILQGGCGGSNDISMQLGTEGVESVSGSFSITTSGSLELGSFGVSWDSGASRLDCAP